MDGLDYSKEFADAVKSIVHMELNNLGLLLIAFRNGKVDTVISPTQLKCFVDGDTTSITIPCNPDVTFATGDSILIVNTARDGKSRFVLCKR